MRVARSLVLVALAALLATCGEPEPRPGWLRVRLSGPETDNAGIMLTLAGGPIDSIRTTFPTIYTTPVGDTGLRVIVGGSEVSGLVAEIAVPDLGAAALYTARLDQIAAGGTFVQRNAAGYQVRIEQ